MRPLTASIYLLSTLLLAPAAVAGQPLFPLPDSLRPAVDFWTRIYTEVDSNAGYLHDSRNLGVIYETLRFKPYSSPRQQKKIVKRKVEHYRALLRTLAKGKREDLTKEEKKLLAPWGDSATSETLTAAAKNLRFQRGQADRLRKGVIRSGAWEKDIDRILSDAGLPKALAVIPHIESSYNPTVRSPIGATGLWQFTRTTGKNFLRIDYVMDERLDPLQSTAAAAELLKYHYQVLGSWPLAITAYNSGVSRVKRAVRKTGSEDIGVIVSDYKGRRFGFASRNFYAAFLAVMAIEKDFEAYFEPLDRDTPENVEIVQTPAYLQASVVAEHFDVDQEVLRQLNPALLYAVWNGSKHIPKGYRLRLPEDDDRADTRELMHFVAAAEGHAEQIPDTFYKVRRGDTLSGIAQRYQTSVRDLVALNNLRSRHRIRAGQSLRLPEG